MVEGEAKPFLDLPIQFSYFPIVSWFIAAFWLSFEDKILARTLSRLYRPCLPAKLSRFLNLWALITWVSPRCWRPCPGFSRVLPFSPPPPPRPPLYSTRLCIYSWLLHFALPNRARLRSLGGPSTCIWGGPSHTFKQAIWEMKTGQDCQTWIH